MTLGTAGEARGIGTELLSSGIWRRGGLQRVSASGRESGFGNASSFSEVPARRQGVSLPDPPFRRGKERHCHRAAGRQASSPNPANRVQRGLRCGFRAVGIPPRDWHVDGAEAGTESARLTGDPVALAEGVRIISGNGYGVFSVSSNGALIYARASVGITQRFEWRDRQRKLLAKRSASRSRPEHRSACRPMVHGLPTPPGRARTGGESG